MASKRQTKKPQVIDATVVPSGLTAFQREMQAAKASKVTLTPVADPSFIVTETLPSKVRMARKHTGELVMQGGYVWCDDKNGIHGVTWKDMPIVQLDEQGNEVPSHG